MTRGFTWCGEWLQVAENADSPLGFSMFINHGTHIFDGASGRMSGSAPNASKSVARGSRQGGIGRYFGHPQPRCCDAGWVSDSPRWCREAPQTARHLEKIPPEFPREIISRIDERGLEAVISATSRPLSEGRKTGCGVNFFGRKIPPQRKNPDRFRRSGL